ncbi:hypothetical protein [Alteromonas stellipolaris]|uniref:hypothetical protein n=1 Tax=Alteromonas stellipolaris TaxID=233316 RepID=UPI0027325F97|nr:hypothetical protein [Alteromonas stellipolaris]MDP2596562.1 hypothetical protein [Alteromonas stellipolaris]
MIKVLVREPRPDFRVFIDLLFGRGRNVDSEGDAFPVFSREWRDLYLKDRESEEPAVEIYAEETSPLIFEIKSESSRLEELAALYLYLYCGYSISKDKDYLADDIVSVLKDKYLRELEMANCSIWHKSSESNPYPNIA